MGAPPNSAILSIRSIVIYPLHRYNFLLSTTSPFIQIPRKVLKNILPILSLQELYPAPANPLLLQMSDYIKMKYSRDSRVEAAHSSPYNLDKVQNRLRSHLGSKET